MDVKLEPKEVWAQQIQGKTVEGLESDLALETKNGFNAIASEGPFKEGNEYTWSHEGKTLTFRSDTQTLVLERLTE